MFLDLHVTKLTYHSVLNREKFNSLTKCGFVIKRACLPIFASTFVKVSFGCFIFFSFSCYFGSRLVFRSLFVWNVSSLCSSGEGRKQREAAMNSAIKQIIQALHTNWTFSCVTKDFESVFCNVPGFIFIASHPGYPSIGKIINPANLISYCYLSRIARTITDDLKWMKNGLIL